MRSSFDICAIGLQGGRELIMEISQMHIWRAFRQHMKRCRLTSYAIFPNRMPIWSRGQFGRGLFLMGGSRGMANLVTRHTDMQRVRG
jgi:hypothetical protein